MTVDKKIDAFLSQYDEQVLTNTLRLREVVISSLPGVEEQLDIPARMIAYCYGQWYIDMICTIIPSKNGVKLGFYKGNELPDPGKLLQGTGKTSRYVEIKSGEQIKSGVLRKLLSAALAAYRKRMVAKK